MDLPVMPPLSPMLAKSAKTMPSPDAFDGGLLYEPKWDGFRCIVFRDGGEVELGSRNERPLTRYFPEVVEAVKALVADSMRRGWGDHRGEKLDDWSSSGCSSAFTRRIPGCRDCRWRRRRLWWCLICLPSMTSRFWRLR
ncbi:MAG: hypothetical protein WKF82_07190 [Nocardioidaceae bacterium]